MTIKAKYSGKCSKCGGAIQVDDKIEWERGSKPYHTECPASPEKPASREGYGKSWAVTSPRQYGGDCGACGQVIEIDDRVRYHYLAEGGRQLEHEDCDGAKVAAEEQAAKKAEAPYSLSGGSGYGCQGWTEGQTLWTSAKRQADGWPEYITVVKASSQYYREDGLSFGVGDDQGRIYFARCRAATEEEAVPVRARIEERDARKAAQVELEKIEQRIRDEGEKPEGVHKVDGERLFDSQNIYGGGSWIVIEEDTIWYVRNNGADGDCWAWSNVRTGGAGAIGWRIPYDETTAVRLRELAARLA